MDVPALLSLLDQITDVASTGGDLEQLVLGFREQLAGQPPSHIFGAMIGRAAEVAELQQQLDALVQRNEALERALADLARPVQAVDGYYPLEHFMSVLAAKMGRTYGWRGDFVEACASSPNSRPVPNELIQKWQKEGRVPAWAVEQVAHLVFKKRQGKSGKTWLPEEYDFLANLYDENPAASNAVLAGRCSEQFGREITENGIKGAIDRLRKKDRLAKRRALQDVKATA